MNQLTTLLPLLWLTLVVAADEKLNCPNNYTHTSTLLRLKKQVLCGYDNSIRPVRRHEDTVNVQAQIILLRVDFDEKADILTVHGIFVMHWFDYHTLWNQTDFDNISELIIHGYYLWEPVFDLPTAVGKKRSTIYAQTLCGISFNGEIWCGFPTTFTTSCSADITRWPYDTHVCTMETQMLGMYSEREINLTFIRNRAILMHRYLDDKNNKWELISSRGERNVRIIKDQKYPVLSFIFELRRHSGLFAATSVIPAVVLMMMTLLSFWMVPGKPDRLIVIGVDVLSHFSFLIYLGKLLPANGNSTPLVVTFYRDSLLITTLALLAALIERCLSKSSQSAPPWTSGLSNWFLQNRFGQVILISSPQDGEEVSPRAPSSWQVFTSLLDKICFVIAILVYIILIFGFMP